MRRLVLWFAYEVPTPRILLALYFCNSLLLTFLSIRRLAS